jgi:GNAT superfamily N-acetyltransferase
LTAITVDDELEMHIATEEDAQEIFDLPPSEPFFLHVDNVEAVIASIRSQVLDFDAPVAIVKWVIRNRQTGAFLGWYLAKVSTQEVVPMKSEGRVAELSVQVHPDHVEQGIASRAGAAIRELLGAHGVEWAVVKIRGDNEAASGAARALERAGFVADDVGRFDRDMTVQYHWLWKQLSPR